MVDESLVEMILRDRSPYGWDRQRAVEAAERYESWLRGLATPRQPSEESQRKVRHVLERSLLRAGRGAALYAAQGRGKTNALAVVTQLVLVNRPDWEVFTNVPYPWWSGHGRAPPRMHLTESLSGLLKALSERTLKGKWSAVIIDEFDQSDTSHSWATDASESWAKYLFIARHYMTRGPLVVFHSFSFIPKTIRGGAVGSPFKLVNRGGERAIADLENPDGEWVCTVPESDLPYLTFGLRGFKIDVDVQELEAQFTGPEFAGDVEAVAKATLKYLDRGPSAAQQLKAMRTAEAEGELVWLRLIEGDLKAGKTYRKIQEERHVSSHTIARVAKRLRLDGCFPLPASGAREPRTREGSGTSTRPDEDEGVGANPGSTT